MTTLLCGVCHWVQTCLLPYTHTDVLMLHDAGATPGAAACSISFSAAACTPFTLCWQCLRLKDVPLLVQVPMHWMNCNVSPAQKRGASNFFQPPPKPPPRRQQPAPPAPEVRSHSRQDGGGSRSNAAASIWVVGSSSQPLLCSHI